MLKDTAQLAVFICGNSNLIITEELLELIPVHGITVGEDIFCELQKMIEEYELPFNKLVCLVTGDSPVIGSNIGVVGQMNEKLGGKIHNFHFIIHQEDCVVK
jgi:hypothetical protein